MVDYHIEAHWRDSGRNARFFLVDARAAFPLVLFLLHIKIWTFVFAIIAVLFFAAIEHYGFSIYVFLRWLRNFIAGPVKRAKPWWSA